MGVWVCVIPFLPAHPLSQVAVHVIANEVLLRLLGHGHKERLKLLRQVVVHFNESVCFFTEAVTESSLENLVRFVINDLYNLLRVWDEEDSRVKSDEAFINNVYWALRCVWWYGRPKTTSDRELLQEKACLTHCLLTASAFILSKLP